MRMQSKARLLGRALCILNFAFCISATGCAARRISLPTDPGTPLTGFAQIHEQLSAACSGVRTLTAELGLSGRAGDQRLRGRVIAGFERPASMHLEGVAPFGPPAFILAARANAATLLLPRDSRIVRNARPEAILGALTGVSLGPADLQAILSGCVVAAPRATAGRLHANGFASIDIASGPATAASAAAATIYLRRVSNQWELRAARRDGWEIEYSGMQGRFPQAVRLQSTSPDLRVDLFVTVSQLETNVDLDAAAFTVTEPPDALPLSIEELREAGPLRGN
jgi:hypothetical protein